MEEVMSDLIQIIDSRAFAFFLGAFIAAAVFVSILADRHRAKPEQGNGR
jgi:hypothetical protein